ncbi:LysR family transcriptional regulator [Motilimonas pumila]|uniref:LysR family transcriptional regulator n=1 Tax=Motilimonas pumila TaxID=2303987 RepID=A0A418YCT0_9GAMM|nr:LysR family transcriptional regulator [Motilimonas pumila]RJG42330.1 LysR family transcriptional regulator [Motilimonas pumila]
MLNSDLLSLQQTDINLLLALDVLLTQKQVSKAAEVLSLTQPAMSQRLAKLRQLLNDPLLVRGEQGYQLTPAALQLKPQVSACLQLAQHILHPEPFDISQCRRTFRFTLIDFGMNVAVRPLLETVLVDAPHIGVEFIRRPENVFEMLENGELDLAIGGIKTAPSHIHARALPAETYRFMVGKHHPLAATPEADLATVMSYPHAKYTPTGSLEPTLEAALKKQKLQRHVTFKSSSVLILQKALTAGKHVALMPWSDSSKQYQTLELVPLQAQVIDPISSMMYWHSRSHKDPLHIWIRQAWLKLLQHLIDEFSQQGNPLRWPTNE